MTLLEKEKSLEKRLKALEGCALTEKECTVLVDEVRWLEKIYHEMVKLMAGDIQDRCKSCNFAFACNTVSDTFPDDDWEDLPGHYCQAGVLFYYSQRAIDRVESDFFGLKKIVDDLKVVKNGQE